MFEQELEQLKNEGILRTLVRVGVAHGARAVVNGRNVLLLCSNDYLGLAGHPALQDAARPAMEHYGFGSGASRLVSGTTALHEELEQRIAAFKGAEAALLFNSGYAANTGIIPAIAGEGDIILSDSLNHASIIDGCRLSRARTFIFRHKDGNHVEDILRAQNGARRKLIVTDGVFSMDGDISPLPDLAALAEQHGAILMVDDAHGTGVLGTHGRGTTERFGLEGRVPVQMGTLSKAFGSFGAYVAGSRNLIDYLVNKARSFLFSTSLPPAVCAASLAALDVLRAEPWRITKLWDNRRRYADGLHALGIGTGVSETPILPVIIGDSQRTLDAGRRLLELGVYAPAIRPPTVPRGAARIRTTVTAALSEKDIDNAIEAFRDLKREGCM